MHLIEGTHYMRREIQPSPAPHKSKEDVALSVVWYAVIRAMTTTHKSGKFARKDQGQLGGKIGFTWFHQLST
jgi:hypothetical protein